MAMAERAALVHLKFLLRLTLSPNGHAGEANAETTDMELSDVRGTVRSRMRSTRQTYETWHPRQDSNLQPTG